MLAGSLAAKYLWGRYFLCFSSSGRAEGDLCWPALESWSFMKHETCHCWLLFSSSFTHTEEKWSGTICSLVLAWLFRTFAPEIRGASSLTEPASFVTRFHIWVFKICVSNLTRWAAACKPRPVVTKSLESDTKLACGTFSVKFAARITWNHLLLWYLWHF